MFLFKRLSCASARKSQFTCANKTKPAQAVNEPQPFHTCVCVHARAYVQLYTFIVISS